MFSKDCFRIGLTFRSWTYIPDRTEKNRILRICIKVRGRKSPSCIFHKPEADAEFRAMTPPGFAEAFYKANR